MDMIKGWVAYVLTANSNVSLIFFGLMLLIVLILAIIQFKDDKFDLRDIICENGVISTTKSLLSGAFLTSSYYLIEHGNATVFSAYLLAWVSQSGIKAWQNVQVTK